MPRRPRLHAPQAFYHVVLRGNHRQDVFFRHEDRDLFERILVCGLARYGARVHAYCWMTNHVHLVTQVGDDPLGRLMQYVASRYARCVQSRLATSGHLWERRYRAILIDADRYLLALLRYIHLNPVRAGISQDADGYSWSSHRAYCGYPAPDWLTTDLALRLFSANARAAHRLYRRFVGAPVDPDESAQFSAGSPEDPRLLGTEQLRLDATRLPRREVSRMTVETLLALACSEFGTTLDELRSASGEHRLSRTRAVIAWRAHRLGVTSLSTIARELGRDPATLHCAIRSWRSRRPDLFMMPRQDVVD